MRDLKVFLNIQLISLLVVEQRKRLESTETKQTWKKGGYTEKEVIEESRREGGKTW